MQASSHCCYFLIQQTHLDQWKQKFARHTSRVVTVHTQSTVNFFKRWNSENCQPLHNSRKYYVNHSKQQKKSCRIARERFITYHSLFLYLVLFFFCCILWILFHLFLLRQLHGRLQCWMEKVLLFSLTMCLGSFNGNASGRLKSHVWWKMFHLCKEYFWFTASAWGLFMVDVMGKLEFQVKPKLSSQHDAKQSKITRNKNFKRDFMQKTILD